VRTFRFEIQVCQRRKREARISGRASGLVRADLLRGELYRYVIRNAAEVRVDLSTSRLMPVGPEPKNVVSRPTPLKALHVGLPSAPSVSIIVTRNDWPVQESGIGVGFRRSSSKIIIYPSGRAGHRHFEGRLNLSFELKADKVFQPHPNRTGTAYSGAHGPVAFDVAELPFRDKPVNRLHADAEKARCLNNGTTPEPVFKGHSMKHLFDALRHRRSISLIE
jgi:hypothetical protein